MLEVQGLMVRYGDASVLDGVSFTAQAGQITTIIGPNGCGKTTLLRALAGLLKPSQGRIVFEGREIQGTPAHALVQAGLIMVPEGRRLWPSLSVQETLIMGAYLLRDRAQINEQLDFVYQLFPHLVERRGQLCGTLSGGEQQMVAIGRGLMGRPRLLLMDEPSLGLAPLVVREVFRAVQRIVAAGTTILLVEQNTQVALTVAALGYVLESGSIVLSGPASQLRESPHVKEAYLGL
jgi:branched-chain amino acid transport system ATP-binding protein